MRRSVNHRQRQRQKIQPFPRIDPSPARDHRIVDPDAIFPHLNSAFPLFVPNLIAFVQSTWLKKSPVGFTSDKTQYNCIRAILKGEK